ncbi:histidine triad nucleotide-binding protein [Christensenellaceae bacterium NSJ-44]|uniref:Histidine triad nucleotide-binding protein n=1 Tax=Luoshenia tenuis TaxID=2763654 RepID=A0A926CXU0_9FIRM|nr:histidine triad nucleotide-binding protein [Luoshenia tenuis]MBC8527962.1 histidine triad nucleotide-binding protein [Luoshenia tenuis]
MDDCIFCKIASHEVPSNIVYEDEYAVAFNDLNPQTPVHVLVVPKKHIASIAAAQAEDEQLLGHLLLTVQRVAKALGVEESGYRVITNCGKDACQSVQHLHLHILGGKPMQERMG